MSSTRALAIDVSVVIPLYNHASSVDLVHARLHAFLATRWPAHEIVFVNDGSSDDTRAALERLVAKHPEVVAVDLDRNAGQSDAVAAGLEAAQGNILVTTDADLETGLAALGEAIASVERGADLACGLRTGRAMPTHRRAGSWLLNRTLRAFSSTSLHDFGCGLNAGSRALLVRWQQERRGRHVMKLALAALARVVVEVPVDVRAVPPEERIELPASALAPVETSSRYGLWRLVVLFLDVVRFRLWPNERPLTASVRAVLRFPAPRDAHD